MPIHPGYPLTDTGSTALLVNARNGQFANRTVIVAALAGGMKFHVLPTANDNGYGECGPLRLSPCTTSPIGVINLIMPMLALRLATARLDKTIETESLKWVPNLPCCWWQQRYP